MLSECFSRLACCRFSAPDGDLHMPNMPSVVAGLKSCPGHFDFGECMLQGNGLLAALPERENWTLTVCLSACALLFVLPCAGSLQCAFPCVLLSNILLTACA